MTNVIRNEADTTISRRRVLARLGLAVAAAYSAPILMQLDTAHASSGSFSSSGRRGRRRRRRGSFGS